MQLLEEEEEQLNAVTEMKMAALVIPLDKIGLEEIEEV